jgi:hypothetical protein
MHYKVLPRPLGKWLIFARARSAEAQMNADELARIERMLSELPLTDRRELARRLVAQPKRSPRSEILAERLFSYLKKLRLQTDCLPTNREIERLAGLDGEDVSYLLKVLRRRGAIVIDYPWSGSTDRTFELTW